MKLILSGIILNPVQSAMEVDEDDISSDRRSSKEPGQPKSKQEKIFSFSIRDSCSTQSNQKILQVPHLSHFRYNVAVIYSKLEETK